MRLLHFFPTRGRDPLRAGKIRTLLPLLLLFVMTDQVLVQIEPTLSVGGRPPISDQKTKATPAGTIIPQPSTPETFSDTPIPLLFRIVNRGGKTIFLQGVRQEDEKVQLFFYHRESGQGWKPFFETLPCDLPTCRNLHIPKQNCGQAVPFTISLGPAGSSGSIKELKWDGLLYQRIEATQENRQRRYCYKGWVPKSGRIRIEIEFSDTVQIGGDKKGMIGGRDHTVIEFDLPPAQEVYHIFVGH